MSRLFWLTEDQVERISPFFPKERGVGRANDRKVLSGIIYVIKNGLQWADAPIEYGPAQNSLQPLQAVVGKRCVRAYLRGAGQTAR